MNRYWLFLIAFPIVAVPAGCGGWERARSDETLRILASPRTLEAAIVGKRWVVPSGRRAPSPHHLVLLRLPDREVSRRVAKADYDAARVGSTTTWHVDPATGDGVAEIERTERTTGMHVPYGLAFLFAFITCGWIWSGFPGGAAEARVRRGGPGGPANGRPTLPPPPREPTERWRDWMSKKYVPLRTLLPIPIVGAVPLAAAFGVVHAWEPLAIMAVHGTMAVLAILWTRARGLLRDRRLWIHGEEAIATLLEKKITGKVWVIEASYARDGAPWTLVQRWPVECDRPGPCVLVDPRAPRRATVVPPSAAGRV